MSRMMRAILAGGVVVLLFDAIGALAALTLGFNYALVAVGSVVIYVAVGAYVGRREPFRRAALAGLAVGAVDATLGWAIAWAIGPGRPPPGDAHGPAAVAAGAATALLVGSAVAALGGWIAGRSRRGRVAAT